MSYVTQAPHIRTASLPRRISTRSGSNVGAMHPITRLEAISRLERLRYDVITAPG